MYWNQTITLYNKYIDPKTGIITWFRHIIHNCFFKSVKSSVTSGDSQKVKDNTIVRILEQSNYVAPNVWVNELTQELRAKAITLQHDDIIFWGELSDEIDEYTEGKRSSDLFAKYEFIPSTTINSITISNFRVGSHYIVRGD